MHGQMAMAMTEPAQSVPIGLAPGERRLTGRAVTAWEAAGRSAVPGFDDVSLLVRDPAGRPVIERAGTAIAAGFGLLPGMTLDARGLAAEARAACDLIALRPEPVQFEAALTVRGGTAILLRGVALPLGTAIEHVQIIVGWREVLNRGATGRLRRELVAALAAVRPRPGADPFAARPGH